MSVNYSYTPLIWPMLISAVVSGFLAVYAWHHRSVTGAKAFAIQELFMGLWAVLTAIDMTATTLEGKFLYHRLEAVAAVLGMNAMLYFAVERATSGKWANRRLAAILTASTLLLIGLMLTNNLHHLIWKGYYFDRFFQVEHGPLWGLFAVWVLLIPVSSLFLFLRKLIRSEGAFRSQALMLFIGSLLPILTYFMEPFGINPIAPLDPVIIMWVVSSCFYGIAIFRFQMLGLVPLGRDRAIERMADGVLVVDSENRIVDLNPSAQKVLGLSRKTALGKPARTALSAHPEFNTLLEQSKPGAGEIEINQGDQTRHYQIQTSSLIDPNGSQMGQIVLLQDITEQKRSRKQIIEQQRSLAALQERERLARELHDSLGQTLAAAHLHVSSARVLLARGDAAETDTCLELLSEMTIAAETDMREYLLGLKTGYSTDLPFFSALHQYTSKYSQQYGIHIDIGTSPQLESRGLGPEVELQLLRIIQETLSNIRKHAQAKSVQIQFALNEQHLQTVIKDDGVGFNPDGIAASQANGFGMQSMRERAESLGGDVEVKSRPGYGTSVIVRIPLDGRQ